MQVTQAAAAQAVVQAAAQASGETGAASGGKAAAAGPATGTGSMSGSLSAAFKDVLHGIDKGEAYVDRVVRLAAAGRDFSPTELIAIQAGVYRYSQELEALSKIVDATVGCVRRTLEAAG